jgi:predicted AAA+ superfamily ATPase
MLTIKRKIYDSLLHWKNNQNRKPLLLRGARQVGKTTLVRAFANEFENYIELNLEKEEDRALFSTDDIHAILNAAFLLKRKITNSKPTLLFIDEIQESPRAIQLLRYFYEDRPDIFVIAAGSLLEFALKQVPNFPVGRIEYMYVHPLNFQEFLAALENEAALEIFHQTPIPDFAHSILLKLFHEYLIIGGMPEIVKNYIPTKNISQLVKTYRNLWQGYKDDVLKYTSKEVDRKIIYHIMESAPFEMDRIKFEGFGNSNYRSREVGEALRTIDLAKIIQLMYPSTSTQQPISTDLKKRPRLQFLDTGLLNQVLSLQGEMLYIDDFSNYYKGRIIQHLIYQEIISIHDFQNYKPHFWVREEKDGNSEVDLIYHYENKIIPIEIKSGTNGSLKSLHQFIERTNHTFAIRLYAGKFSVEKAKTPNLRKDYILLNLPYYLTTKLPEYIKLLVSQNLD